MDDRCFICGAADHEHGARGYQRCRKCGHETLVSGQEQVLMVNDDLSRPPGRPSWVDRFQCSVLTRLVTRTGGCVIDIGCGAGLFLHRVRGRFVRVVGIEISPPSVRFAREKLLLEVVGSIDEFDGIIDVATAWHSLEHVPAPTLASMLTSLRMRLIPGGCVIVSVPNAASYQSRWLGTACAFYDPPGHLHQFTPASLERLFSAHGYNRTGAVFSWPYIFFGWVQGLLNLLMPGHNHAYYRLKRGYPSSSVVRDLAALVLLPLVVPPALLMSLLDVFRPERQAVLTWRFEVRL